MIAKYEYPRDPYCIKDDSCHQCAEEFSFICQKIKEQHIEDCRLMFNDLCIIHDDCIGRLIGFCDDGEDFYYIAKTHNNTVIRYSMVGACSSLKNILADYNRMDAVWEYNCPKETEFRFEDLTTPVPCCKACGQELPFNKVELPTGD